MDTLLFVLCVCNIVNRVSICPVHIKAKTPDKVVFTIEVNVLLLNMVNRTMNLDSRKLRRECHLLFYSKYFTTKLIS